VTFHFVQKAITHNSIILISYRKLHVCKEVKKIILFENINFSFLVYVPND